MYDNVDRVQPATTCERAVAVLRTPEHDTTESIIQVFVPQIRRLAQAVQELAQLDQLTINRR